MRIRRLLPLLLIPLLAGCPKVPVTGRRSMAFLPDSYVSGLASDSYQDLIRQSKLSQDPAATEMVRRVGSRIAAVSNAPDYKWEYNLIDDPKMVNAFCMPGGKVAVYTGILPVTQDETGLAVVLGHEIAHAVAKHGSERLSQQLLLVAGNITLEQAIKEKPQQTKQLAMLAFGAGATLGFVLPYGRMQESESDRIGLIYMARAGYDPREAIAFWRRMEEKSKGQQPPQFLSTHPSHDTRIRDLEKWMPEAMKEYEKAKR